VNQVEHPAFRCGFYHFLVFATFLHQHSERMNERTNDRSCPDVHKSAFPCREPVLLCARDIFLRLTIKPVPLLRDRAREDCYYVVGWTFFLSSRSNSQVDNRVGSLSCYNDRHISLGDIL